MKLINVEGVVISTVPYKENSKIINIFTKDMGIIGCISKGCKSMKSKLRLPSEKFAYGIGDSPEITFTIKAINNKQFAGIKANALISNNTGRTHIDLFSNIDSDIKNF